MIKAILRSAAKETLPQHSAEHNSDKLAIGITTLVDFVDDSGKVVLSQPYFRKPADFDVAEFDRIAASLQGDIDHTILHAADLESNKAADVILEQLQGKLIKLELGDTIELNSNVSVSKEQPAI